MLPSTIRSRVVCPKTLALLYGALCHTLFVVAIVTAQWAMYHGMHWRPVALPWPLAVLWDLALLFQFPVLHSFLLTRSGGRQLQRLAPSPVASDLSTTTFTIVASLQMLLLFGLWAPFGGVWWEAHGIVRLLVSLVYLASWLLLGKAMADAGLATQTGFLGWSAVFRGRRPVYEPMPEKGLFRLCRQPIYLAFALTTWTVPTWSGDQLLVALWFTGYCLLGPLFKERRYSRRYGQSFADYKAKVPYIIPTFLG